MKGWLVGWLLVLRPIFSLGTQAYRWSVLHRVFLKDPSPYLRKFRRKSLKTPNGQFDKSDHGLNLVPPPSSSFKRYRYATNKWRDSPHSPLGNALSRGYTLLQDKILNHSVNIKIRSLVNSVNLLLLNINLGNVNK